ncbi:MAG: hypothetical protein NVS2B15_22130 [Pseudarthrobacter sp.]
MSLPSTAPNSHGHLPHTWKQPNLSATPPKTVRRAVLHTYLIQQVHALTEKDPRVRLDAVHKMRVA